MKFRQLSLVFLFVPFLCSAQAISVPQTTAIPDANFEQALIDLGIDSNGLNGNILNSDAVAVTGTLDVSSKNIVDLSGIEVFTELTQLYCSSNQLTSLDVSSNTSLTTLICPTNQLTSLNVSGNTSLNTLFCNNNLLTTLDVSSNPSLATLYCYTNSLTSLNVSNNGTLNTLLCYSNQLSSLDISSNLLLTILNTGNNNLNSLDVTNNTALTVLNCYQNNFTDLDVSKNTALTQLRCSRNLLASLDISNNGLLQILDCSNNVLPNLDVSNNAALTQLYTEFNQLTSLDITQNTALTRLYSGFNLLTSLDLSQNASLTELRCIQNDLVKLNVKNGNNTNITTFSSDTNPNLLCIQVDDATYSLENWTNIDPGVSFSTDCQYDDDGDGVTNDQEIADSTDPQDGCSYVINSQIIANVTVGWNALDCDCDGTSNGDEIIAGNDPKITPPTGSTTQSFCSIDSPTVAELLATGTGIQWYSAAIGGTALVNTLAIVEGTSYYASQTVGSCVSTRFEVAVAIDSPAVPTGTAMQFFCGNDNSTIADLSANGSGIQWYDTATGGIALATTTALASANYYASQTVGGCESTRIEIAVNFNNPPVPTGSTMQYFCVDDNATVADLSTTGTTIQWYATATGGTPLVANASLANGNYYSSQTVDGCESTRFEIAVNLEYNPSIPTGSDIQSFCYENNPTVADLEATGSNILWYDQADDTTPLPSTAPLTNRPYANIYGSQTIGSCESARLEVLVDIITVAGSPTGETYQNFCIADSPAIANLLATGTDIKWYGTFEGSTTLADNVSLTDNTSYFASQATNMCGESIRFEVVVTVDDPSIPTGSATQNFCIDDDPTVADLSATGTGIQWYETATGGTSLIGTTSLITTNYYASQTVGSCEGPRLEIAVLVDESVCDITTGIDQNAGSMLLYPTSTAGKVIVELEKKYNSVTVSIIDIMGKGKMTTTYSSTGKINFNINGPRGIYFVEVQTDTGDSSVFRILKN